MPENTEQETARVGSGNRSNMTINRELQANKTRIGSAKYYDIASALMGKGKADLEELFLNAARDGDYDRIETFLLRRSDVLVSIDVKDKRTGNTPLIWAATRGHSKIVQLLLKHGADITLRNYENQTAVEVASPTIRTLLLDSVERTTETSHRLLLQAAWQGNIKVLRKLLSENKVRDINCQNSEGLTALLLCCRDILIFERMAIQLNRPYNPLECVQELLAHRADVHAVDGDEMTCLHYVSKSKAAHAQAIIQTIITAGPNIESKDKRLFAPIHCASQSGNVECIEALLEGGSDVNSRGFAGATPLHITAYNDHEKAACTLLKHGANVTLTDDRGLTALDLARGRKMKVVLKEAWTEATQNKPSTNLAPLKTPGREDSRLSIDETKKKKGGEVIFDGLPSNPFSNMKSTPSKGKLVSRHLSLREKARKAEESMMADIENGNFTPSPYIKDGVRRLGQVRGQRVSPSPLPKSRSGERLPALSPDLSFDRDSPAFNRNGKYRRSFEEGKSNLGNKTVTHPAPGGRSNRVSPLTVRDPNRASPLTIIDTDVDQCMQINRMQAPSPTPSYSKGYKRHHRSGSDTAANFANITSTCDTLINNKGRAAPLSHSEDFSDRASPRGTKFPRRDSTLYNTLSRETTQKSLYNQEGQTSQTTCELTKILDLDRMGLTNRCPQTPVQGIPLYPTSSKILPPTPTFYNQKTSSHLASGMIEQKSDDSKDPSPRSDDEDVVKNPEVKMAFSGTLELLRSRSIYKDEFVLEESRPRDLSLRSSSSEDSQGSKQSFSSGSSNNNRPINQNKKPDMARAEETKKSDKLSSSFSKKPATQSKQKVSVGNSVTFSNKDTNTLNKISVSTAPGSTGNVPSSVGIRNPSVVKNKITIHSQQLNDTENKSAENKNTQSKSKSSAMQVVSSKLLSNVKEEIRTELLKDVEECVVTETSKEDTNTEDEKIAKEKLTKSMSDLKSDEKEPVLQRPATQASAKTINRVGPPVQAKTSVKSKVILASSNQSNRNTMPSYLQPTRSSALRKSNSQDSNVVVKSQNKNSNTKVLMEVKQTGADKPVQETADNKKESNSESNMKDAVNAENNSCSVPLEINTGDINCKNDEAIGLVDPSGATGKVTFTTNSPGATKTVGPKSGKPVSSGSASHIVATHSSSSPQSARTVTNSANSHSAQKSASSGRVSAGIISRGSSGFTSRGNSGINSRGNSGITTRGNSGITSRGNSGINSRGPAGLTSRGNSGVNARGNSGTGVKKSQSDSSIAENHQMNSKITEEQGKVDHDNEPQNGKLKSSSMSTINEAMEKNVTKPQSESITINSSAEGNNVLPNFQYKPASAGKPPLVEIVTSNTPRRPKPEPVVKGPVQTPVIEDPFAEMYEDKGISSVDIKTNGRGVSATQYGYVVTKPTIEKSKTNISIKSRGKSAKKKDFKPSSANPKQVGKRRGGVKSKENKNTDDAIVRPKSGKKRCRSGKRRKKTPVESALSRQATQPDVALISGIGWHLAASCIDTSDVTAVKCRESSTSSDESDDNLDEPTPRPPPFMFDDLELITSQNYDMHIETPREFHPQPKHSKNLHLEIYKNIESVPTTPSPRFRQVKPEFSNHDDLPKVDNDGYRPMNLDLTQSSLPKKDSDGSEVSGLNSLPDVNMLFKINQAEATQKELDDILNSDPEVNETNEAVYRQILIDKLTPIPESPSLSATTPLHKTLDALKLFDANVKEDTLNALLGLNSQTPRIPNDLNHLKNSARISNSVKNESEDKKIGNSLRNSVTVSGNRRRGSLEGSKSSSQQSSAGSTRNQEQGDRSGAGNKSFNPSAGNKSNNSSAKYKTNNSSAGNKSQRSLGLKSQQSSAANRSRLSEVEATKKSTSVRTSDGSEKNRTQELSNTDKMVDIPTQQENQSEELQMSIENLKAAIQQNKLKKNKRDKMIDKDVPMLDLKPLSESGGNSDEGQSSRRRKDSTGRTSRRERRFSETKSDHEHEENIDEVVDEILSNTTSSVRSNKTLTNVSRNSTLTEADKQLLLKMTSSDSPFHAKFSASVSDDRQNENVHPVEEINVQHPTDPNLLQVYQKDKVQVGKKMRSSVDSEAITKVMNSFKHMELYAGGSLKLALKGSREHLHKEHIHRPHVSMGEPSSLAFGKPPVALPSKVKAVGKFTEIRSSKQENSSMRNSTQKEESHKFSHHAADAPNFPDSVGIDDELAQALRANSPENVTINSDISTYTRDLHSRADSACTTDSCQSYSDETIQWKKGNVLGKGAFGTVWCGLTSEGQLIAVKQIELNTNDKDKAKREYEKVQEEVELLKLLNHKNIVGYLGTSLEEEDSLVSIFMQFVPGGSIASILARFGALDEAVFRRYTKQILEGVAYLHSNDVIHRDIKGGNVMLMPNGIIKLIDFGCAKRLCINLSMGQSQILKSMKGTPYWMAPEVVNETGHGKKSDIWSVGCTVFEMATRKPPWADMNPMAAIFAIGSDRTVPKLPDKFSPEAVEFVDACLTRDQSKRPSATQLLQNNFIMKRKNSKR